MLYNLLLYKARWGDINIPNDDAEHAELLGWVLDQRDQYKFYQEQGSRDEGEGYEGLTPDRISVLDTM